MLNVAQEAQREFGISKPTSNFALSGIFQAEG
jgi:hypothetical protein